MLKKIMSTIALLFFCSAIFAATPTKATATKWVINTFHGSTNNYCPAPQCWHPFGISWICQCAAPDASQ